MIKNVTLEISQGDDYLNADGRAITFVQRGVCWPTNITSVKFISYHPLNCCNKIENAPSAIFDIDGTFVSGTNTTAPMIRFDLHRIDTLKLPSGVMSCQYEVRALLATGSVISIATGAISVLRTQL